MLEALVAVLAVVVVLSACLDTWRWNRVISVLEKREVASRPAEDDEPPNQMTRIQKRALLEKAARDRAKLKQETRK